MEDLEAALSVLKASDEVRVLIRTRLHKDALMIGRQQEIIDGLLAEKANEFKCEICGSPKQCTNSRCKGND